MEPTTGLTSLPTWRTRTSSLLRAILEGVVLALVCLAPWAYGAVHPGFEFLLSCGLAVLLALWGARMLVEGRLSWQKCPVALCLAALFLAGVGQLIPLPKPVLGWLSPATARLQGQLLPAQPELLPDGSPPVVTFPPPGSTLSLYPSATRARLTRLLAVFLVFVVVRNNLDPGAPWRLAVVAVGNGALLAVFALVQFFSSPHNTLYWTYPSLGSVFGPFICRNHFPFYLNLCVGLGLGLLWGRHSRVSSRLLDDAPSLWLCVALSLMFASVAFSLSRGGWLALVGAGCVCMLLRRPRSFRSSVWGVGLLSVALALGLGTWLGFARVEERLATLWGGDAFQTARLPLWTPAVAVARDFPLVGVGAGVYQYIDPLYRGDALFADFTVDHLHNDYLELLVESGGLGLLLGLFAIALVLGRGWRAVRVRGDPPRRGLALGYLFGFLTFLIHSFGDFGLHIPAITLLATVLSAHLCALGSPAEVPGDTSARAGKPNPDLCTLRLGGLAPVLGAAVCLSLGLVLCAAGWRAHLTEGLRQAAFRLGRSTEPGSRERQIACLQVAVNLSPGDAELHAELGQAHLNLFGTGRETLTTTRILRDATGLVLGWAGPGPLGGTASALALFGAVPRRDGTAETAGVQPDAEEQRLIHEHLLPALRHHLWARNLCPLLAGPQMGIALNATRLRHADPRDAYMTRAQSLAPSDPVLWYSCGLQELLAGQPEHAWQSWRHSLELSDRYLPSILERRARGPLGPEGLVTQVLPERPEMLLAAAARLDPQGGRTPALAPALQVTEPLLRKALELVDARPEPRPAEDLHTRARALDLLGRTPEALAAYQAALGREPRQMAWRFEFARLLYEEGRLPEAREELLTVLAQQPRHAQASELLQAVAGELSRHR